MSKGLVGGFHVVLRGASLILHAYTVMIGHIVGKVNLNFQVIVICKHPV